MGTTVTSERPVARITQSTGVSVALVVAMLAAAMFYGRQSERLDSIDSEVRELRTEVKEIRTLLIQQRNNQR